MKPLLQLLAVDIPVLLVGVFILGFGVGRYLDVLRSSGKTKGGQP